MDKGEMLTPREVAEYLRVPIETVWHWCREGTLPAVKIGKYWRIPREELRSSLASAGTKKKDAERPSDR